MWTLTELELLKKIKKLAEADNVNEILRLVDMRIAEIEQEMQREAEYFCNLEEV